MKVTFVRHKDFDEADQKLLWQRRQAAIRFQDIPSKNPDDYDEKFKRDAIARLRAYCEEGVLMAASYRAVNSAELLVGTVGPGNPDELIQIVDYSGYPCKVVQLENVRQLSARQYPILAIRPTHGTLSEWHIAGKALKALYEDTALPWSVRSLSPSQLEVLCYEYLRMTEALDALVMPIGRGMPDIDIYGIRADGHKIVAQVTHSSAKSTVDNKKSRLLDYEDQDIELVFFGPRDAQFEDDSIHYIAIEDVFDRMTRLDAGEAYNLMVKQMLGY